MTKYSDLSQLKKRTSVTEAELEEMDRPRLEPKCGECGATIAACNAQANARRLAEQYYRQEGKGGIEARQKALDEYPDLRRLRG